MRPLGDSILTDRLDAPPGVPGDATSQADSAASSGVVELPVIEIRGIRFHAITEQRCIEHILESIDAGRGGFVVTPNLDHLKRCVTDFSFAALVSEASLVVADGMPLIWASRLQRTPLPERVAGSNLISSLSAAAARRGRSIYLLGGAPGTADRAAEILRQRDPNLKIVGTYCPPVGFETNQTIMSELIQSLIAAKPDIIYVALGSPKQEELIDRIRRILPASWWLGVGISFSFLAGDVRRAPKWMQRSGLEWTHRLLQEPKRLFGRYVFGCIPFGSSLMVSSTFEGIARRFRRATPPPPPASPPSIAPSPAQSNGNGHARANGNGNGNGHGNGNGNGKHHQRPAAAPVTPVTSAAASEALRRVRGLVLLGGSVRPTPLRASIGRSVLDLPVDEHGSILNHWLRHAADISQRLGLSSTLPVRVLVNQKSREPVSVNLQHYQTLRVERDLSEFRGTGGVLGDLSGGYEDDDVIIVANAAQILLEPLHDLAAALAGMGGDVAIVAHDDGTPSGVMLVRCKTLRIIPKTGFVDMKEQALPIIASKFDVRVLDRAQSTGLPVRSLADYVAAMRRHHRHRAGLATTSDPLAEDWRPSFAIVEDGATVDPTARVHDSVVLSGGVVEAHAVVVRSVVCPGGVVRRDRSAVDQFVTAAQHEALAAASGSK